MRPHSLAIPALILALFAAPAVALDIVELKSGKLLQIESARVTGDRLFLQLVPNRDGGRVGFSMPIDKVVPEFVYYIWAAQVNGDVKGHMALAEWARKNGLFKLSWKQYEAAGQLDPAFHSRLPKVEKEMFEEQATWVYEDAEQLFRDGDTKRCRMRLDLILKDFAKSKETARAEALLGMLAEREQFLSEQKKQEEIAERGRKQRRRVDKYLKNLVDRADTLVRTTRMGYHENARGRLHWAAYAYRKAYFVFDELLLVAEVDGLRQMLENLVKAMKDRMAGTFIKLADLRWIDGDVPGALDAVHEVLAVDPGSKTAAGLRERILDEGGRAAVRAPVVAPACGGLGYVFVRARPGSTRSFVRGFGITPTRTVSIGTRGGIFRRSVRTTIPIPYYPRHFYR